MKTNNILPKLFSLFIALLLFACASTPKTPDAPLWDTQGIQRVAVMPFEVIGQSEFEHRVAIEIRSAALECFQETGRFIIVETIDQADAILRGEIIDIMARSSAHTRVYSDTGVREAVPGYDRTIIFSYSLTRTSDNSIVGENSVYDNAWYEASQYSQEGAINVSKWELSRRLRKALGAR